MRLSPEQAAEVRGELQSTTDALTRIYRELAGDVRGRLKSERAREYLAEGVCRRIKLLDRCIENIFTMFPPERVKRLDRDELSDVAINLHAFVVNVYGVLDNLAWVYVMEKDLEAAVGGRTQVGLFNKATQKHLPPTLLDYLRSERTQSWYSDYAKNYRDALAHRIPLYVPPLAMTKTEGQRWKELEAEIWSALRKQQFDEYERLKDEQEALGSICAAFAHSMSDADAPNPVVLHAQLIADARTILEAISKVREHL